VQETAEQILKQERAEIADVREIVNSGATGVNTHFAGIERNERVGTAGERVVKANFVHDF
jgi:hypothetical protein